MCICICIISLYIYIYIHIHTYRYTYTYCSQLLPAVQEGGQPGARLHGRIAVGHDQRPVVRRRPVWHAFVCAVSEREREREGSREDE